jgi:hypothetical protein
MAPAKSDVAGFGGGSQRPVFGPAVWAWGPACGLVLWGVGFLILPWWAAIFLWWWPSLLFGAALGLATIGLAKLVNRVTGRSVGAARKPGASGGGAGAAPIAPGSAPGGSGDSAAG